MKTQTIQKILEMAVSTGGDFSEVYIEEKKNNSLAMTGKEIDTANSGIDTGIGIRIFKGNKSVYTYTNDFDEEYLLKITKEAAIALVNDNGTLISNIVLPKKIIGSKHQGKIVNFKDVKKDKVRILGEMYEEAKNYSPLISQVKGSILDVNQHVIIANSDGVYVEDTRSRVRMMIQAIATKGQEMMTGYHAPGASMGFEYFDKVDYLSYAKDSARIADTMIKAEYSPSGQMPVVIDNGFGGVIFHEACGHGLEATSVAKKTSVFTDKIGEKIASECVTAIDDGTIENAWGSANFDDEGHATKKNILIENGILKNYLMDRLDARRMKRDINGAARRQSYRYAPTSRMSNTYIANGDSKLEDMISSIEYGIYAKNMGGGSVNPATGEFNFAVLEGYLVENGKIVKPVRGSTLVGKGHEIIKKIDMVGNNLAFGQGMCGSSSGSIPADVGQPAIRVSKMTVGGRA